MTQQILADIDVDAALFTAYAQEARRLTGAPVRALHLVAKAVGRALRILRRPATDVLVVCGDRGHGVAVAGDAPVVDIARQLEHGRTGTTGAVVGADVVGGDSALPHAYPPLRAYSAAPVAARVGAVREQAVVVAGRIVARPILTVTLTADPTAFAAGELAAFAGAVHDYLANPHAFEPPLGVGTVQLPDEVLASPV